MDRLQLWFALILLIMYKTFIVMIASFMIVILSLVAITMMQISDQIKCAAVVTMLVKIQVAISIEMEMAVQLTQRILSIADYTILKAQRQ